MVDGGEAGSLERIKQWPRRADLAYGVRKKVPLDSGDGLGGQQFDVLFDFVWR
jgi:hypothetical protein